jgi:hypothetical protein
VYQAVGCDARGAFIFSRVFLAMSATITEQVVVVVVFPSLTSNTCRTGSVPANDFTVSSGTVWGFSTVEKTVISTWTKPATWDMPRIVPVIL